MKVKVMYTRDQSDTVSRIAAGFENEGCSEVEEGWTMWQVDLPMAVIRKLWKNRVRVVKA